MLDGSNIVWMGVANANYSMTPIKIQVFSSIVIIDPRAAPPLDFEVIYRIDVK